VLFRSPFADFKELVLTPTPRVHGYDFTHKGLLGIWDGFLPMEIPQVESTESDNGSEFDMSNNSNGSSHIHSPVDELYGDFQAALAELASRRKSNWKPGVATAKTDARRIALALCNWPVLDEEMTEAIIRLVGIVLGADERSLTVGE
jgi:WD repeat-containing protein mio